MKFLLVDDHILFREGMKHILHEMQPDVEVLEASNSTEAITMNSTVPDINLILLDLQLPDLDGLSTMKKILSTSPTSLIVILTASELLSDMRLALTSGAMGYISKNVAPGIMIRALQLVLSGGIYVPPAMITYIKNIDNQDNEKIYLTPRQTEILKLIIDGHSNKQLAVKLGLTEATIKTHVSAIFKVLKVKNRTQAAMMAQSMELDIVD